ncbi:MAG TPA: YggS family pyridoxal phosphate-dependent enzyme [Oribacterium sp.]|nr:YggS family pyridoxal phosphate-dependent enzyme [Oribacterium sp.]
MIEKEKLERMQQAVETIRSTMAEAAIHAGRRPEEILLCAACKTRTVEEVMASAKLPIDIFGENHVQELVEKTDAGAYLGKPGHFIGHLQTNKVKKVVGRASLIQSVDSEHLALAIEKEAAKQGLQQDILLEVNIGEESSKSGVNADGLWALMESLCETTPHLHIRGLMAIPPADASEDETRAFFAKMRGLYEEAAKRYAGSVEMKYLSMGMSGDYALAIAEGANIVRIGTAIYGPRDYSMKK